jgi:methylmalonyl-CoA/ethylmalonyl-CoA epimerase
MVEELDHVAIAVRDLEEWTRRFEVLLGRPVSFRGSIPEDHVLTAQFHLGETKLELIAPSADQGAVARRLRDAGEGVYLIAVRVDDLEATLARLREQDVRLVGDPGPGRPIIGHVFVHPKEAGGVMIQLTPRARQEPA